MSTALEAIPSDNSLISEVEYPDLPLDLLSRDEVIAQLMQLLNIISDNKLSYTFALNGTWGTGKTFVLNRLMKQLLDYQDGERFFVFHYNCWQYDYYEEPLVAIVAAMLDSLDHENHMFSKNLREQAKQGMAVAKPILEKIAKDFIVKKIGIDITDLISFFKDSSEAINSINSQDSTSNDYDKYYSFKKAICSARDGIRTLSENRTVVVIVDELDRCLPSYSIKVMERLHHLFAEVSNCAVILAIDKGQLDQSVHQIFGSTTDTTKYLKKFINFEVALNTGRIKNGFTEKYADYCNLFDNSLIETDFSLDMFFSALLAGTDVRSQERIVERVQTVHRMLFPNTQKDYSFMCAEIMWVVFSEQYKWKTRMPITYEASYQNRGFQLTDKELSEFTNYMKSEWSQITFCSDQHPFDNKPSFYFPTPLDIPQLLIWYLSQLYPRSSTNYRIDRKHPNIEIFQQNVEDLRKVISLLEIIK